MLASFSEPPPSVLTGYVCADYVHLTHRKELKHPEWSLNIPGRGIVKEWKIVLRPGIGLTPSGETGTYILSGKIISNNEGGPKQGVPIYVGDLSRTNAFKLMALSDADGCFKFALFPSVGARVVDVDKYLFVGNTWELLLQYEIPYWIAQLRGPADGSQPFRSETNRTSPEAGSRR